jgi:ERF superfamily
MVDRQYISESINELSAALAIAQQEMKHAAKDAANPFFKSKYAALPDVIDASRPYLSKHGLSVAQLTDFDETGKIFLVTQLNHKSGQWMRSWYPVDPVKKDPQGLGSALTYARRYSYSCITGVVASDEDDDGEKSVGRGKVTAASKIKEFKAIQKALMESDDPAYTWGQNLFAINQILEDGEEGKDFYDQLVNAGKVRKEQLGQDAALKAGMPEEFNRIKGD